MFQSAYKQAGEPPPGLGGLDMTCFVQQRTDDDPGLKARERGPDTEVRTFAKTDVSLAAWPVKSKCVGVVEVRRVSVGRSPQEHEARSPAQTLTAQRCVVEHVAIVTPERRFVAQHLVQEGVLQFGVIPHLLLNFGAGREDVRRGSDQRRRRLASGTE